MRARGIGPRASGPGQGKQKSADGDDLDDNREPLPGDSGSQVGAQYGPDARYEERQGPSDRDDPRIERQTLRQFIGERRQSPRWMPRGEQRAANPFQETADDDHPDDKAQDIVEIACQGAGRSQGGARHDAGEHGCERGDQNQP